MHTLQPELKPIPDRFGDGSGEDNDSQNHNNTAINFYGPQFIVNSEGNSLNLLLPDKKSVTSHPFHGGLNQQWLVHEDGSGAVALMSKYNRTYVALKDPSNQLEGMTLVSTNVPFWFEIYWDRVRGYKLAVPDTDLGINLVGESAKLGSFSSIAGLFILKNTSKNQDVILRGQHIPSILPTGGRARSGPENEFNTGAKINVTINDLSSPRKAENIITSDGVKHLVINLGHPLIDSRAVHTFNTSDTTIISREILKPNTTKRAKLVISQSLPVPASNLGTADIIGFGTAGVAIVRNSMNVQKYEVIPNFGHDAGGWRIEKHVRLVADTTGNKGADIVGFGENGVWISLNNGDNTFQAPEKVLEDFSYEAGWRVEKHLRFMADVRNTGRADIIGFGDDGVLVSFNNGDRTFSPSRRAVSGFDHNNFGWRLEKHLRFLADITGNGFLDIVGFGESEVSVAYNNGDGTFQPPKAVLTDLCYSTGWRVDKHPRFVADLTGDGKLDLVGFADDGLYAAFNNGDGTFQPIRQVTTNFSLKGGGWLVEKHPRVIADLTGNGCGDIIGFGEAAVYVGINNGDGTFQPMKLAIAGFSCNGGWRVDQNPRFVVDLTGNGRADIIGFGNKVVYVSYNDGKGNFTPMTELVKDFGYDGGWPAEKTVRYAANLFG